METVVIVHHHTRKMLLIILKTKEGPFLMHFYFFKSSLAAVLLKVQYFQQLLPVCLSCHEKIGTELHKQAETLMTKVMTRNYLRALTCSL